MGFPWFLCEISVDFYGFPHGFCHVQVDPWHWESNLVGEDPTVDALFIKGASHCEWMHAVKPGMPGTASAASADRWGPGFLRFSPVFPGFLGSTRWTPRCFKHQFYKAFQRRFSQKNRFLGEQHKGPHNSETSISWHSNHSCESVERGA